MGQFQGADPPVPPVREPVVIRGLLEFRHDPIHGQRRAVVGFGPPFGVDEVHHLPHDDPTFRRLPVESRGEGSIERVTVHGYRSGTAAYLPAGWGGPRFDDLLHGAAVLTAMAEFQVVVGDPDTGDSYRFEVADNQANRFLGRTIGEEVDGGAVGLDGYTLEISGGSDTAGRPLRADISGSNLREVLADERTVGYKPTRDGERRRVTVRGNEITDEVAQLNARIVERGDADVTDLLDDADEV